MVKIKKKQFVGYGFDKFCSLLSVLIVFVFE